MILQPVLAQNHAAPPAATRDANGGLRINLVNADIASAVQAVAAATGQNFIVDPRVKGQITLQFEQPVSPAQVYRALLTQLRLAGYAVVEHDGVYQVVPEADAKLQSGPVGVGLAPQSVPGRGDQVVTQIFQLRNASASSLLPVLRPLISPNNTINVSPGGNALVITDYADNLKRIARIIAGLDVPTGSEVTIVPLRYAVANELAPTLQKLIDMQDAGSGQAATARAAAAAVATNGTMRAVILPEDSSNSLIVRATNGAQLAEIERMITRLDRPQSDQDNIHVVYLRNANAVDLARTLRGVLSSDQSSALLGTGTSSSGKQQRSMSSLASNSNSSTTSSSGSSSDSAGLGQAPEFTSTENNATLTLPSGGTVYADNALNALIINTPQPVYQQLRRVIEKLDVRRAQVYVEALIAEVDANKAAQLGIQWQSLMGSASGNNGLYVGSNYGSTSNIVNLQAAASGGSSTLSSALASGTVGLSAGLNIGVLHEVAGNLTLGLLANFLQTHDGANILSAPNLMTLDNQEAKIVVGQNVPFVTGQYAQTGSSSTVSPFQTIERKDVGLTLKVRPQITAGNTIKMDVYQEVSSISSTSDTAGIITNKRSIQTAVLVNDGQTIVLGGLMQDNVSENNSKIPGLGDIPGLGALFRSKSRTATKTDLMVFLRPIIVRSEDTGSRISQQRYDTMRGLQKGAQLPDSIGMPHMPGPVLPGLDPEPAGGMPPGAAVQPATDASVPARTALAPPVDSTMLPAATAQAVASGNTLQYVSATQTDHGALVEISFQHPVAAKPSSFVMDNPARVVLDFDGADTPSRNMVQTFDAGPLQAAQVTQGQGKARVVLDLTGAVSYTTELHGNKVLVTLTPRDATATAKH